MSISKNDEALKNIYFAFIDDFTSSIGRLVFDDIKERGVDVIMFDYLRPDI